MDNLITQTKTQKFLRSDVALTDLTRMLAVFARVRDWESFHSPRNLLLALSSMYIYMFLEEVGEVGEMPEIFEWRGEDQLSNVLLYLVRLADVCNVNLGEAALEKLRKNASKYPVDNMKLKYPLHCKN
ncbi:hypothetical protein KP509_32G052300 [Ceratopteris richardii]|uniref:dCTP pyrophosphatase 1 n=1 Tax=Ceratopteris richardii TaxID=49495 RepID=A0A8T2QUV8_CERRI|nr:hypothetical protein KP509_32G052300 [Ceratopteris richardii]